MNRLYETKDGGHIALAGNERKFCENLLAALGRRRSGRARGWRARTVAAAADRFLRGNLSLEDARRMGSVPGEHRSLLGAVAQSEGRVRRSEHKGARDGADGCGRQPAYRACGEVPRRTGAPGLSASGLRPFFIAPLATAINSASCASGRTPAATITSIRLARSLARSHIARAFACRFARSAERLPCLRALRLPFGAPAPLRLPAIRTAQHNCSAKCGRGTPPRGAGGGWKIWVQSPFSAEKCALPRRAYSNAVRRNAFSKSQILNSITYSFRRTTGDGKRKQRVQPVRTA